MRRYYGKRIMSVAVLLLMLLTVLLCSKKIDGKENKNKVSSRMKKIDIEAGTSIATDIDGDTLMDIVSVTDIDIGNQQYTLLIANCGDGEVLSYRFEGKKITNIVSGDIVGNRKADIVVIRKTANENDDGCEVTIMYEEDKNWCEYPYDFYTLAGEFAFSLKDSHSHLQDALILETDIGMYLRLFFLEAAEKNVMKYADCYFEDGRWHIAEYEWINNINNVNSQDIISRDERMKAEYLQTYSLMNNPIDNYFLDRIQNASCYAEKRDYERFYLVVWQSEYEKVMELIKEKCTNELEKKKYLAFESMVEESYDQMKPMMVAEMLNNYGQEESVEKYSYGLSTQPRLDMFKGMYYRNACLIFDNSMYQGGYQFPSREELDRLYDEWIG